MNSTLINGRAVADEVLAGLAMEIAALGVPLQLAAVCAGDDPGLRAFVKLKQKAAQSIGIQFSSYLFGVADEEGARQTVSYLASDETVHGIFVELPLPSEWDTTDLLNLIPASKDVDVLTPSAEAALGRGDGSALLPPAVRACRYVIDSHAVPVVGRTVAIVGAGRLVGAPMAQWFRREGSRVEVIDIGTPSPAERCREADLVITATGVPGLVTADWIKDGATVIDFGYGRKDGAYVGDVDAASVQKKAGLLTPVPGGMGPLVVAAVLENLVELATR